MYRVGLSTKPTTRIKRNIEDHGNSVAEKMFPDLKRRLPSHKEMSQPDVMDPQKGFKFPETVIKNP